MKIHGWILAALFLLGIGTDVGAQTNIPTVATIAAMEALGPASAQYPTIQVLGYNTAGDGGGGLFIWASASVVTAEPCVTFAATGVSTGRWVRQLNGVPLSVEDCGAYNDGTHATPTRAAFQAGVDYIVGSNDPNAELDAFGSAYLFDGTGVVVSNGSFFCPRIKGGGETSTIITFSPGSAAAAFTFESGVGARCNGGITDVEIAGNYNTTGVTLSGTSGATVHINMATSIATGVNLCNCVASSFTELNNVLVDSDGLLPAQQTIILTRVSGNTSYAGNMLGGYVSLGTGNRSTPIMQEVYASGQWYNGSWNMNVHNIGGGGAATLLGNSSSNCIFASVGTLQIETANANPVTLGTGCIYYGGTVYALGADLCVGVLYPNEFILAKNVSVTSGVSTGGADQYCLTQTFVGNAGVVLSVNQIQEFASTYSVTILNGDNSYNETAVFSVAWNTSGPGTCSIASVPVWAATIDTNSWGPPATTCSSGRPSISNASWPSSGMHSAFTANYNIHGQ